MISASYQRIRVAVVQKLVVTANYHNHYREFCPHVIGMTRGREHVLGYQFTGSSSSGLPARGEWRCFNIAELSDVMTHAGSWHTSEVHQPQTCVEEIDVRVA